jgi:hypothetical protein
MRKRRRRRKMRKRIDAVAGVVGAVEPGSGEVVGALVRMLLSAPGVVLANVRVAVVAAVMQAEGLSG